MAPGAGWPVELSAPMAARASRRELDGAGAKTGLRAAPWADVHGLGEGALAEVTLVFEPEGGTVSAMAAPVDKSAISSLGW